MRSNLCFGFTRSKMRKIKLALVLAEEIAVGGVCLMLRGGLNLSAEYLRKVLRQQVRA